MADLVDLAIPANAQAAAEALGLKVHRSVTRAGATNTARGGRDRARMSARLGNPCANSEGHSGRSAAMSKKKDRAWFVCPQWGDLVSKHYASDTQAGWALKAHPAVLAKLQAGTPVPKSTALKMLRRSASRHELGTALTGLVVDTRSR